MKGRPEVQGAEKARREAKQSRESGENTAPLAVSVIVPVCNGGEAFRQCLISLAQATPPPVEIIVVDDGSTDGSGALAEEWGVHVLSFAHPGGPARARNHGAQAARGDVLLFVDADVTIPCDAIAQIHEQFKQMPNLAALIGSYDDAPAAPNFLSQYRNLLHHYVHQQANEDAFTFWGACGAVRREAFWAVAGFDEAYRQPSIEDIELGHRLKQAGYYIRVCKTLQVKHWKRWDIGSLLRTDIFCRAIPWTLLLLQTERLPNDLNIRVADRISTGLVFGFLALLVGSWWWTVSLVFAGIGILLLLLINASLYRFFWSKRGLLFTALVLPWHWLYYCCSGLAFSYSVVRYLLGQKMAAMGKSGRGG